jgi:predicted RNase H-like HicB family nuclease
MNYILQFKVCKEDDGYSASAMGYPIFTQGDTFEELVKNIQEATSLYFEDEQDEDIPDYTKVPLLLNFELPPVHA